MGRPAIDITGQRFGKLIAKCRVESEDKHPKYYCECDCGGNKIIAASSLRSGYTKSCGCSSKRQGEDLTGKRFGKLVVLEKAEYHVQANGRVRAQWKCKCDCGKEHITTGENLRSGNTKTCGCSWTEKKGLQSEDLVGKRFGKLVVDHLLDERNKNGRIQWWCVCDCGKEKAISGHELKGGLQSCGCLKTTLSDDIRKKYRASRKSKMGLNNTRLYRAWVGMKMRCYNPHSPKYYAYGDRGITVCSEWIDSFDAFVEWAFDNGYKEEIKDLSLDRIDVNGNYEPLNCRWVSAKRQANNKRNNIRITLGDETYTLSEWCDIKGIKNKGTIYARWEAGWPDEQLFLPTYATRFLIT